MTTTDSDNNNCSHFQGMKKEPISRLCKMSILF